MNASQRRGLIETSLAARERAYCPYSHYQVGAALLAGSGKIFAGCNVENASYGLTICAERSALVAAVSAGERAFEAIVIATADGGAPCGACRQVLMEFEPELIVIVVNSAAEVVFEAKLIELLPHAFSGRH